MLSTQEGSQKQEPGLLPWSITTQHVRHDQQQVHLKTCAGGLSVEHLASFASLRTASHTVK